MRVKKKKFKWITHEDLSEHDVKLLGNLCELQEEHLELIPKELDNRILGMALEQNMDILREISCRDIPAPQYVKEKTCNMLNSLNELGFKVPKCKENANK